MDTLTIPFIVVVIALFAVIIGWSKTWYQKEHYRCRVFELTDGKEGSNIVIVKPSDRPPTPPKKPAAPHKVFIPLRSEWFESGGEYFRKSYIIRLTVNPNGTVNAVLADGHSINTGLEIGEMKDFLGENYMPNIREDVKRRGFKD